MLKCIMKICSECQVKKSLNDFNQRQTKCKPCQYLYLKKMQPNKLPNAPKDHKVCRICGKIKKYDRFQSKINQSVRLATCLSCRNIQNNQYAEKNREVIRQRQREYYDLNREKCNTATRLAQQKNPAANLSRKVKRRGLEKKNIFIITTKELSGIKRRKCFACNSSQNITIDHSIPLSRGGNHSIGNLIALCATCNYSKNNLTYTEWKYSNRPQATKVFGENNGIHRTTP